MRVASSKEEHNWGKKAKWHLKRQEIANKRPATNKKPIQIKDQANRWSLRSDEGPDLQQVDHKL